MLGSIMTWDAWATKGFKGPACAPQLWHARLLAKPDELTRFVHVCRENAVEGFGPDLGKELRRPQLQKSWRVAAPSPSLSALVVFIFILLFQACCA